jgi:isopentenyl-diphosphate delta-isomerase
MIEGNALILHLNPLQEAVMEEGDTDFAGLISKIERVCQTLTVPVIVKEVGWGISRQTAVQLYNAGVSALDVAGAGGTSWTEVEKHRAKTEGGRETASAFTHWGIPTAESIQLVRDALPEITLFASGGIRNGIDIAKSIALGADLGGMAGVFLHAAAQSPDTVIQVINRIKKEIQICMFAAGISNLEELSRTELRKTDPS